MRSTRKVLASIVLICGWSVAAFGAKTAVDPARASVQWSQRELAYLQSRGPIRMCVAPDWMPIEGIDRQGRHTGMAADFIRLMTRHGGLNIELVPAKTWEASFALGQRRQCDIFSLLMDSPSRRSFLDFTTPYLEIPGVIATSVNVQYVAGLEQVRGRRLGHMRGFAGIELLRQGHPDIQLVEVRTAALAEQAQCRAARRRPRASVFINEYCTDELNPTGVAVITYEPITEFAVHETTARPERSVSTE